MLGVRRFALKDITIGGVRIPVGGRVWVSLISANRDGTHFASPASFDPTWRSPGPKMSMRSSNAAGAVRC
ncbi:cytochrome P450 [Streptomyces coeruleorubidus]|uniref:cytochrome P450 n=1 Tax=Streptomyces coeruleorubidus TaxID=116188 RepID=UPI0037F42727